MDCITRTRSSGRIPYQCPLFELLSKIARLIEYPEQREQITPENRPDHMKAHDQIIMDREGAVSALFGFSIASLQLLMSVKPFVRHAGIRQLIASVSLTPSDV